MTAALAALGLAAALVLGGLTATPVLVLAVLLAQGLFVAGWFPALRVPGAVGGRLVVAATAVGADAAVLAADDTRPAGARRAGAGAGPARRARCTSWSGGTAGSS